MLRSPIALKEKEKGNINTPLELAMNNQIDRFTIAIDVIDRVPKL
jgi:xylulose-5-phosphate/fructose-6-phosphate phosphoketolase